jgi:TonB family protein
MWTRMRPALSIALLSLILTSCQSLAPEQPSDYESLQEASDVYLAYERGDCERASRLSDPTLLAAWDENEIRHSTLLVHGFCQELNGDTSGAREVYETLMQDAPESFAARDAKERARIIRINESDPGHADWMRSARDRAKTAQNNAKRVPVERQPASFPPVARATGIEGYAVVEFGVTPRGRTSDPIVIESKPAFLFDGAAIRAVRRWEYEPDKSAESNDIQVIRLVFKGENLDSSETQPDEESSPDL